MFINGIPLAIIESKSPTIKTPLKETISQHIRNQMEDGIQNLYVYSQILGAISLSEAKYATTIPKKNFGQFGKRKTKNFIDQLPEIINVDLTKETESKIFFKTIFEEISIF